MKFSDIKEKLITEASADDHFKYAKVSIGSSAKGESVSFFDKETHEQFHEEYLKLVKKYNDIFEARVQKAKAAKKGTKNESLDESEGKNGYICFYNREKVEVYADTTYEASQKALPLFQKKFPRKKIRTSDITPKLAEKDGKQHVGSTLDF